MHAYYKNIHFQNREAKKGSLQISGEAGFAYFS